MSTFVRSLRMSAFALTFATIALTSTGCGDDNPAAPNGDETAHADLDGVVVMLADGTEIARQWEADVTGAITVTAGATLDELEIWFLDADGDMVRPGGDDHDHDHGALARRGEEDDHDHDGEEPYELEVEIGNDSIATAAMHGSEDWAIDLTGVTAGATTVRFIVMHEGHADFTSLQLPITVEAVSK